MSILQLYLLSFQYQKYHINKVIGINTETVRDSLEQALGTTNKCCSQFNKIVN